MAVLKQDVPTTEVLLFLVLRGQICAQGSTAGHQKLLRTGDRQRSAKLKGLETGLWSLAAHPEGGRSRAVQWLCSLDM